MDHRGYSPALAYRRTNRCRTRNPVVPPIRRPSIHSKQSLHRRTVRLCNFCNDSNKPVTTLSRPDMQLLASFTTVLAANHPTLRR